MFINLNKYNKKIFYRIIWDQSLLIILFSIIIFFTYDHYNFEKTENITDKVINSFYFSTVTQFTVGYGELYPITNLSKITNIIHNFLSYFLVALELVAP